MLAGKGFKKVYNLSGGIKSWDQETAFGDEYAGLELFSGNESAEKTLTVAYSLEQGLRDFYLSMAEKITVEKAKQSFTLLAEVEIKHQKSIFSLYRQVTGSRISRSEFEEKIVVRAAEGGLTTEQYLSLFGPTPTSTKEIAVVAISIEAQALDLYQRAAERSSAESRQYLLKIANEEQAHLNMLAQLVEES
jgi:rubrerythrin